MEFVSPSQHYCFERSFTYSAPSQLAKGAAWVEPSLCMVGNRVAHMPQVPRKPIRCGFYWAWARILMLKENGFRCRLRPQVVNLEPSL